MSITDCANPRQTVLVSMRTKKLDNIITLDWHMPLSFKPMMYAISIGKTRYSRELIQESKTFVVNFMAKELEKEVLFCGRHSGHNFDKFKETSLTKKEATTINCPIIKQAVAYLECTVEKEFETGDHFLFIANVTKASLEKESKRIFHTGKDSFTTTS